MTREVEIDFTANPVQGRFIRSQATADLWASRMGEGKSAGLAWAVYYHTRYNPGAKHVMVRDTWENLRKTTQKEFFKWFSPGVFGTYHATNKEFTWAEGVANGNVLFLGLDDPDDAGKLQSLEVDGFAFDEPAPVLSTGGIPEAVFDIALSRLRGQGMKWYPMKLATNNPDESHWTYRRFVDPGMEGFAYWQADTPENEKNLKSGYYAELRRVWGHRPDLIRRFIEGKFGYSQSGKAVTPEWSDDIHLATGLGPVKGVELVLCWDFGLNPTCVITQVTPQRHWNVLDAEVGEGIGVAELCETWALPILHNKYRGYELRHIGDPAGDNREQSTSKMSAVRMILKTLGGKWRPGPRSPSEGIEPLRRVLTQTVGGVGMLRVDRRGAPAVWQALRGGWHYHMTKTGVVVPEAVKNIHSHPGDAMRYGAGVMFPLAIKRRPTASARDSRQVATYFGASQPGSARDREERSKAELDKRRKPGTLTSARTSAPITHGDKLG